MPEIHVKVKVKFTLYPSIMPRKHIRDLRGGVPRIINPGMKQRSIFSSRL
jgi:hypothetical protein